MLRRNHVFDRLATYFVRSTLLGDTVDGAAGRVLAGERWVEL